MKKLLALLLALTLIFTFAACGDGKGGGKDGDGDSTGSAGNTYETPIEIAVARLNATEYTSRYEELVDVYNGFCEDELKALIKLSKQTETYEENIEENESYFEEQLEETKSVYGSDFKYSYKITEKEKLDEDELEDYANILASTADEYDSVLEELDSFDEDYDWENWASSIGLDSVEQAKEYRDILEDVCKKYKNAKVEEGYNIEVDLILSGSELEEDDVDANTVTVLKIDGRWVPDNVVYGFMDTY